LKKPVVLGLLTLSLFCLIATTNVPLTSANTNRHQLLASNVEQIIDYGNSTQALFQSLAGVTVFDILNGTTVVVFTQYAYGKFVTSINGVENNANDNGFYWQYWVNGELAPVAADSYILADGDKILWKYCAPENAPTTPPTPGPELIFGLGIIFTVGTIVVIAATITYLKIR
jgi:hypothetical protein